ncbi:MAG: GntR family transcriptional regulator [Solirubrobacterales bacterium]|jgi:DNA-binding FadR family transcriptional regulator|nr:GntR family transcriptional regulator [Solirubrobacterales bacterium]
MADGKALLGARVSRAEAIARELENEIAGGTLESGERLGTKQDLRHRFGVAVATINEAVRLLEIRGLISARPGPGGGVFVADSSTRVAVNPMILGFNWHTATRDDYLEVLQALEPLLFRDAARYRSGADARALEMAVDRLERSTDDVEEYLRLSCSLRRRIAKVSRNAPLHSVYLTLIDFLEDGISEIASDGFDVASDLANTRELVEAIVRGDDSRPAPVFAEQLIDAA